MRKNTFYDSKLFAWIRNKIGFNKPVALSWVGWKQWERDAREEFPIAYFFVETFPSYLDRLLTKITNPYHDARYYIMNRFIRKTHYLRTNVKPGDYSDPPERILAGVMNCVVDFVEIELAYKNFTFKGKWKNGRSPEAGIDLINFHINDPYNSVHSTFFKEVKEIYLWWKFERPSRPDVYDVSGWSDFCSLSRGIDNFLTDGDSPTAKRITDKILNKNLQLEQEYNDEDEQMLIRVAKIRLNMWA